MRILFLRLLCIIGFLDVISKNVRLKIHAKLHIIIEKLTDKAKFFNFFAKTFCQMK